MPAGWFQIAAWIQYVGLDLFCPGSRELQLSPSFV